MTSRRWDVGAFGLALVLPLLAQLPSAGALAAGRAVVGPDPTAVDTTTTLTLARKSATAVADAWQASSLPTFLLDTFWAAAVRAASVNHVDLVAVVDPTLRSLGWPLGWTALALGVLVLNTATGWYAAASLGAGRAGRFAAALTLGSAGAAGWLIEEGQLANAVLAPFAVGLAALVRLWRGEARAAGPAIVAAVLGGWLYWLNAVLLAGMAGAWALAALAQRRWPARRGIVAGGAALVVACLLLWPGVRAVLGHVNDEGALTTVGVSAGTLLHDGNAVAATIDQVPWARLVSPTAGYLWAAGGVVGLAALGARARETRPLLAVVALGAALAVGPFPAWPTALGGRDLGLAEVLHASERSEAALALRTTPRTENPAYAAFSQLGAPSRMRHPVRWGLPLAAALALLAAAGADALAERRPRAAWAVLLGSAGFVAVAGPLRLTVTPVEAAWAAEVPCAYLPEGTTPCVTPVAVPSFAPLSTRPGRFGGGRAVKLGDKAPQ